MAAPSGLHRAPAAPAPVPAAGSRLSPVLASPALLGGSALVALQLLARGYSVDQIAGLRRADAVGVLWDLQRALTAMGVTSVRDAVAEARALGLLV